MATPEFPKQLVIDHFTNLLYNSYKAKKNCSIGFCIRSDTPIGEKTRLLALVYQIEVKVWTLFVVILTENSNDVTPISKEIPILIIHDDTEEEKSLKIQSCVEKELEDLAMFDGRWLISTVNRVQLRFNIPNQIEGYKPHIIMEEKIHFYARLQHIMNRYPYLGIYQDYSKSWLKGKRLAMPDREMTQLRIYLCLELDILPWHQMMYSESKIRTRFTEVLDAIKTL